MTSSVLSLFNASALVVVTAIGGGLIPLIWRWKDHHLHYFISFGAGVLMGAAFLHMIPEAMEILHRQVGVAVLLGFFTFYFIEKFIMIHPCREDACEYHALGLPAFVGFSFHHFADGLALGASYFVPALTPYVLVALVSHHIPTSFAFTSILKVSRYSLKKIFFLLLIFALMIPVGALLCYHFLARWSDLAVGWAVGLSSGTFIHIAICDLLPEVHKSGKNKWKNMGWIGVGLATMFILSFFFNH